jgi:hypothetical protein
MREDSYPSAELNTRPDIVEVVERYTSLKKFGREFFGLAPCHDDRHPSLRVNPEKQVWFCDPCATGGDVIKFIQIAEGVDFKGALQVLGMGGDPQPPTDTPRRRAANWAREQIQRLNSRIHELDEMIDLADEIPDVELAESLWRERIILADLRDDLLRSEYRADFLEIKELIEAIGE